jgi:hypothetical protein
VTAVPFDTLKLAERLQAGGFTSDQARAAASALAEVAATADLVTKPYLDDRLLAMEQRLIIRLGGLAVVLTGIALAVMHYLPPHG